MSEEALAPQEVIHAPVATMPIRRKAKKKSHHKRVASPPPPPPKQQSLAIAARWDAARASEAEVRARFSKTLSVPDALAELAALRKTCEFASFEINQRLVSKEMRCEICKKVIHPNKPPALVAPERDIATGTLKNLFYCSAYCVRERNAAKLGLRDDIK